VTHATIPATRSGPVAKLGCGPNQPRLQSLPSPELAADLFDRSAANAFFVEQLLVTEP
jgi:hypothetical protein